MRDRLIELILECSTFTPEYEEQARLNAEYVADHLLANGVIACDTLAVEMKNRPLITQCLGRPLDEIIELVQAKDDGRIIVPPCKIGDTVYVLSQGAGFSVVWNVCKSTAEAIHLDKWGQLFVHVETDKENIGGYVEVERIFCTKEEAEEALAKMKGGAE